jgi:pimeloyl-ACP methyl ester carboxylesterase
MTTDDPLAAETGAPPRRAADAKGRSITYREAGDAAAPALVLLHGVGSGSAGWALQLKSLPARGWRVIAWDAPGYGGSSALGKSIPVAQDYAEALVDLVAALGLKKFCLLGHSLGALIAASYCRLTSTARVEKLILASPASGYGKETPEGQQAKIKDRLTAMQQHGPEGLAERRASSLFTPNAPPAAIAQARAVMRRLRPEGYIQALAMLARADIFNDAPGIAVPTLVMCGSGDNVTPEAGCRRIATAISGARYETLPGPGHGCYAEAPALFDATLLRFLAP